MQTFDNNQKYLTPLSQRIGDKLSFGWGDFIHWLHPWMRNSAILKKQNKTEKLIMKGAVVLKTL